MVAGRAGRQEPAWGPPSEALPGQHAERPAGHPVPLGERCFQFMQGQLGLVCPPVTGTEWQEAASRGLLGGGPAVSCNHERAKRRVMFLEWNVLIEIFS